MTPVEVQTITDFLLARIAEDEALAQAVVGDMPRWDSTSWEEDALEVGTDLPGPRLTARWSPDRVLAECEAKRRIVAEWENAQRSSGEPYIFNAIDALAAVYADHPDYREEWKP